VNHDDAEELEKSLRPYGNEVGYGMDLRRPILLVEDNEDDIESTRRAFDSAKLSNPLVVARDGVEAIDYLFGSGRHAGRDLSVQPVVVLLDLKLPRLNGLQVLETIRDHDLTAGLRVVVITSSNDPQDIVTAANLRVDGYMQKPVDFENFVLAAREVGLYWSVASSTAAMSDAVMAPQ
jgi:CheY-like chemotaxis protein